MLLYETNQIGELQEKLDGVAQILLWTVLTASDEPYSAQYGFQDPATVFFEKLIDFHHDMLFLMVLVLVFVFYMLVSCILNFNQWASSLPAPDVRYNAKIETIWTLVPTVILLMVVVPAFSLIYSMDDTSSQPLFSVKIAGNQWYWTYEYVFLKTSDSSSNSASDFTLLKTYAYDSTMLSESEVYSSAGSKARLLSVDKPLYLPANTLLTVYVTAYDVIHSWTVPSFGVKLDGCPGRSNSVSFAVKRPGLYYGQCSEICGVNHGFMPIEVRVYPFEVFLNLLAKWK